MFRQYTSQELRHPPFNGIRVAVDEGADTEDGSVQLPKRYVVCWRFPILGKLHVLDQAYEPILEADVSGKYERRADSAPSMQ